MPEKNAFNPDWVSPPGATITDILDAQSYSVAEFAKRMAFTPRQADDLLAGRLAISPEIASPPASRSTRHFAGDRAEARTRSGRYHRVLDDSRVSVSGFGGRPSEGGSIAGTRGLAQ